MEGIEVSHISKLNTALNVVIEICKYAHLREPKFNDGKIEIYGSFNFNGDPITFLHNLNSAKWINCCFDNVEIVLCNFMIDINNLNKTKDLWGVYWFQKHFNGIVTF